MYPEAGAGSGPSSSSSRPSASSTSAPYPSNTSKLPPTPSGPGSGLPPPPRSSRWEGEYERERERDERSYPPSSSSSRSYPIPPWQNRAPPRQSAYRPHSSSGPRPRSLTPSPPRRGGPYDRERDRDRDRFDVRDRLSLDSPGNGPPYRPSNGLGSGPGQERRISGYAPPPPLREREPSYSRWSDRYRDREREDHRPPPRYPPRSPPSAPRGPRSTAQTPPSYASRLPSLPPQGRSAHYTPTNTTRQFDRSVSVSGPSVPSRPVSPSLSASGGAARTSRSQRGSSSPVESRRTRDDIGPSSEPTSQIPLPDTKANGQEEQDLEEGEVISPVQATRVPSWSYNDDSRTRRAFTPPRDRERDRWDRDRQRERRPPSPPPPINCNTWSGRRNLDDAWNKHERSRKRSSSNPTRWNGDVATTDKSPGIGIGGTEEGEVATASRPSGVVEKKMDRPPTPPVPPPPPVQSAEKEEKMVNGGLEVQDTPSRPDTPSVPPPSDSPVKSIPPPLPPTEPVSDPVVTEQLEETKMDVDVQPEEPSLAENVEPTGSILPSEIGQASTGINDVSPPQIDLPPTIDEPSASQPTKEEVDKNVSQIHKDALETQPLVEVENKPQEDVVNDQNQDQTVVETPMDVDEPVVAVSTVSKEEIANGSQPEVTADPEQILPNGHVESPVTTSLKEESTSVIEEGPKIDIAQIEPTAPAIAASEPSVPLQPVDESAAAAEKAVVVVENIPTDRPNTPPTATLHLDSAESTVVRVQSPSAITSNDTATPEPPTSPPARRVTIAERRAIQLPPTNGPLSSPFGDGLPRKDPMPTAYSTSTDAETEYGPKTADIDENDTPIFEEAPEEIKQANLIAAIKAKQINNNMTFDPVSIIAWNVSAAPASTTRVIAEDDDDRSRLLKKVAWPLKNQQRIVAKLVATTISREEEEIATKAERLKNEYLELDQEWQEHCNFLDSLMEKRGEVPADLYAVPGALPVVTPGPVAPSTPLPEDLYNARGNRRRGAGDAVHTEAEFEAILAGLADTAAKDPTYRANKTSAVVPDMLLDEERKLRYDDDNDLVEDPLSFYDFKGNAEPIWTTEERAIFVRRYMAYPKQFGRIADGIPNKTASDCVLYYYRTKKEVDYKGMLASKRGGGKKKTMPIKKGGKSAALLADMDRQKPTVSNNEVSTPGRGGREREESVIPGTSARKGKLIGTPAEGNGGTGRRRKTTAPSIASTANDDDDKVDSAVTSRAGSEAPSTTASKAKMRVTMKTAKRPRNSSISETNPTRQSVPTTPSAFTPIDPMISTPVAPVTATLSTPVPAAPVTATPAVTATPTAESLDTTTAQSELLPPVKRAGKRRKVVPEATDPAADPNGTPIANPAATPTTEKPTRRSATNSYWSVEEKRKVKELVLVHGADVKAIAAELKGKSERQVGNFLEGHRNELVDGNGAPLPPLNLGQIKAEEDKKSLTGRISPVSSISGNEAFRPAQATRTIYDAYPSFMSQDRYEPRLGMFPPSPPPALPATMPDSSPLKPVSRTGGMRISALLNDDAPAPVVVDKRPSTAHSNPDTIDAASDGTVDERDFDGMTRPSPRSVAPAPAPTPSAQANYGRYDQRPDFDRYRSSTASPYPHQPPTSSSWSNDIYRASTTTPVPHITHRPSWSETPSHSLHGAPPIPAQRSSSYTSTPINGRYEPTHHHHHHHHGVSASPYERSYTRDYPPHHQNSLPPIKNVGVGPPPLMGQNNNSGASHTHTHLHRAYGEGS
ncbi:hypothetical protein I302_105682 [Kwoniella bestiolae CBS 10118]|uniref:SANT domain-containing protein n=1 Tax=Kwoniella bestiolae CBS 10118 TaxID=1296100 RepID=A0A1B9G1V1_9TREE|nr:hypothetical protein I302_04801 [Kwoniella bestiolae CBS 10118]OCF24991.1 hypothetical protein I302_04801 [Kwoniella bestiolae CBS 10118]